MPTATYTVKEVNGVIVVEAGGMSRTFAPRPARKWAALVATKAAAADELGQTLRLDREGLPALLSIPDAYRMAGEVFTLACGVSAAEAEPPGPDHVIDLGGEAGGA
jgi:hypothetical protein